MTKEEANTKFIGMYIDDAERLFKNNSIDYRITYEEDKFYIITCDYNPERLNLSVKNNVIESISFG